MLYSRRDFFRHGWLDSIVEGRRAAAREVGPPPRPLPLVVDAERCFSAKGCPCEVCVERCPLEPRPIRVSLGAVPEVDAEGCTGCGVCAWLCPADALVATPVEV